jgi:hypothetical protein
MLCPRVPLVVLAWLVMPSVALAQGALPSGPPAQPADTGFSLISIFAVGAVVLFLTAVAHRRARRSGSQAQQKVTARGAVAVVVGVFGALAFGLGHMLVRGGKSGNLVGGGEGDEVLFENIRLAGLAGIVAAFLIAFAPQPARWRSPRGRVHFQTKNPDRHTFHAPRARNPSPLPPPRPQKRHPPVHAPRPAKSDRSAASHRSNSASNRRPR